MRAELLVALAPLPELVYQDSMTRKRCYNRCSRGVAQPGSAPALGAGGREFESRRPDHFCLVFQLLRRKTASQSPSSAALRTPMQMPYIGSC